MMISFLAKEVGMFDFLDFPEAPSFKAEWRPIYFEPIVNSGERITILIVVKSENNFNYYEALHDNVIDNLYGNQSLHLKNLIKMVKNHLEKNFGNLDNCIEGVYPGEWHKSSSKDIKGVARQGLHKSASLGSLAIEELFTFSESSENDVIEQNWTNKIKDEFLKSNPSYEKAFNYSVQISKNVKIRCGFHSARYSAKFNVCTAKTIHRIKTSLMDLKILEENKLANRLDLILYLPPVDDLIVTSKMRDKMDENIYQLKKQCKDSIIDIYPCATEKDGAVRLSDMLNVA